jgi:hypothetical protein
MQLMCQEFTIREYSLFTAKAAQTPSGLAREAFRTVPKSEHGWNADWNTGNRLQGFQHTAFPGLYEEKRRAPGLKGALFGK